ncbi:MAG: D-alanyl-D-alanine carboxypeptidase family protein [Pseudomonadota bacterium]
MRRFLVALTVVFFVLAGPMTAKAGVEISTPASHAILLDTETGAILMDKNAEQRMPTSSMSKVMTMYAVFDALKAGRIGMDDTLQVSEKAWRKGGSKMFVEVGAEVKVSDLVQGVVVQSGNDATIVLAEGLAGSEDVFAESITRMAKDLGMTNSNFTNASGWPDPDHYSTPRDLAVLAYRMITDFPDYYDYFSKKEFTYNEITQPNRNPLLYRNMGVDGIKTGHTEAGGYGLMASAERDGHRLVLVVNGLGGEKERATESARLLEWGFNSFDNMTLFEAGETVAEAEVVFGQTETVSLVIKEDVIASIYKPKRDDLKVTVEYNEPLQAPVLKDTKIGEVKIEAPGMAEESYDLYAQHDVVALGLVPKTLAKLKYLVLGRF